MEQTNLEQIKDLVLSSVHIGNSDYPIAILPKDVNIVSLEKHNQFRNQFRAKFSTFNFDSLLHTQNCIIKIMLNALLMNKILVQRSFLMLAL